MTDPDLAPEPPLLAARALGFSRGDERIFGPLELELRPGDTLVMEGGNGAGKTTLVRVLASRSPVALRMGLSAFYDTQDMDHGAAVDHLHGQLAALLATDDAREGIAAFLGKRDPVWKGK